MSKPVVRKLFETSWVTLRRISWPERGIKGYDFLHEDRCDGKIIVLLPYRYKNGVTEFLLRRELTPCWHLTNTQVSSITGGFESEYGKRGTAVKELKEEAGYDVEPKDLIHLGTCRGTKSSSTTYIIYSVDLTEFEMGEATGDGTELEAAAHCFWDRDITKAVDPLVYTAYVKLIRQVLS